MFGVGPTYSKLDPTLRFLLQQQQESLAKTGHSLNLTAFADHIEVISQQEHMVPSATSTESADKIAVLINAKKVARLKALGITPRVTAGSIATAHVTLAQLAKLAQSSNVIYVEASKRLQPAQEPFASASSVVSAKPELDLSVPDTGADVLHQKGVTGRGVIVGVVDTGVDCLHEDFRVDNHPDDGIPEESTRFLAIFDETTNTEYGPSHIEQFIRNGTPCPTTDDDLIAPGHGTQVMGIAAGDGSSSGFHYIGMAPDADLIAVKSTLTDAGILEGVRYIFERAGNRPVVVNLSLGTQKGPHDGTSNLDRGLDALVGTPGHAIVVAAGNQGDERIHAGGTIEYGQKQSFEINIDPQKVPSELGLDFWYDSQLRLNIYIVSPMGNRVGPVPTGQLHTETTPEGGVRIDNASAGLSPNNGANHMEIVIFGSPLAVASGTWRVEVEDTEEHGGRFDAWSLDIPFTSTNADFDFTIGSPGAAQRLITVGSHVTRDHWQSEKGDFFRFPAENRVGQIATFSSHGPTRDGRLKPDLTAPGVAIITPLAESARGLLSPDFITLDHKHTVSRGTSFSSPHVAGAIALLFQQEPTLTQSQIKDRLSQLARNDNFTGQTPNAIWGAGKLSVAPSASTPKPISEEIKRLAHQLDENSNNKLDDDEVLKMLDAWVQSRPLLTIGRPLTDDEILALLDLWQQNSSLR